MFTYPRFTNLFICYSRRFLTSDRENWCESMPQRQKNRRYFCQRQKDGCVRKVNTFRENGNAPCWDRRENGIITRRDWKLPFCQFSKLLWVCVCLQYLKITKKIGLELFEKYQNPIFLINFRVRRLKLKIAKVNLE